MIAFRKPLLMDRSLWSRIYWTCRLNLNRLKGWWRFQSMSEQGIAKTIVDDLIEKHYPEAAPYRDQLYAAIDNGHEVCVLDGKPAILEPPADGMVGRKATVISDEELARLAAK